MTKPDAQRKAHVWETFRKESLNSTGEQSGKARWAAAGLLVVAGLAAALGAEGPLWLGRATRSGLFVVCGLVLLGSAAALVLAMLVLWQAGAAGRRQRRGESGAAIVEFALVLPIALMLVLLMIQSSMLMAGNICVNYAACCAARSAIVTVPLNLSPDEPYNMVMAGNPAGSGKLQRIKAAAVWAVMPVSASDVRSPEGDASALQEGLGAIYTAYGAGTPAWVQNYLARKIRYAEDHTQVFLDPPANANMQNVTYTNDDGSTAQGDKYGPSARDDSYRLSPAAGNVAAEDIRATVEHVFCLSVPYAGRIFSALSDGVDLGEGQRGLRIRASCLLTNEGAQDYVEVERFVP